MLNVGLSRRTVWGWGLTAWLLLGTFLGVAQPSGAAEGSAAKEAMAWVPTAALPPADSWVSALAYSPDGARLAVGLKNRVELYDVATQSRIARWDGKFGQVTALAFQPDGTSLAVGGYQTLELWDIASGTVKQPLRGHRGVVTSLAWSPDGLRLLSSSDDETARVWTTADGTSTLLDGHHYPVNGVAWSRDGGRLATVAGDELRPTKGGETLWRDAAGAIISSWIDHQRAALCAAFSGDGKLLVTGGLDDVALVYDLAENKLLGKYSGHQRPVNQLAFVPGQEVVISIGGGRAKGGHTVRAWRARTGVELAVGDIAAAKLLALAVRPDGNQVVTGGQEQTVHFWDLAFLQTPAETAPAAEVVAVAGQAAAEPAQPAVIRVGVIGLDTSHAPAFAKLMNDSKAEADVAGCRIVAAYPQGSKDIESSTSRVPGYTQQFRDMGIEIVDSIPALLEKVDCVLLESNDGRPHLEQVLPVLKAGKRCFIDKPIAGSLADAVAIFDASQKYQTPVFSSSSLRYLATAQEVRAGKLGKVTGCDAYSPCSLEATHPDLYWYGIHGVEILFTVMGTGCDSVTRASTPGFDFAVGTWSDGRIGSFRGIRQGAGGYGGVAFGEKGKTELGEFGGYRPLAVEIVKFFKTGDVPVAPEETLEIYTFMEAADESKRQGGAPVKLAEVLAKARAAAKLPE